jgi:hypothetical protein
MRRLMILIAGAALALGSTGAANAAAGAASAAAGWVVQPTPIPAGSTENVLSDVTCVSATNCIAVGASSTSQYAPGRTLVERWNGRRWTIQATPNPRGGQDPGLGSVSCSSANSCIAVGSYQRVTTYTESLPLAERWNGHKWTIQATPEPSGATGAQLSAVSCPSVTGCVAAGSWSSATTGRTLAEHWNGSRWTIQPTPAPAHGISPEFTGLSCATVRSCTAVGTVFGAHSGDRTLAEHWNGSIWRVQATPSPSGTSSPGSSYSTLFNVSCPATTSCTATGYDTGQPGTQRTLAEHWNGKNWKVQSTRTPAGSPDAELDGVWCASAGSCTSVGDYATNATQSDTRTLAEHWNGRTWAVQATRNPVAPSPSGAVANNLVGVWCAPAFGCTATGSYIISDQNQYTLAEHS